MNDKLILQLLKLDLGITHDLRDTYFNALIKSSVSVLERKGVEFNWDNDDDTMLIADYSSWSYRKRQEGIPISRNLQIRINERLLQKAGRSDAVD